MARNLIFVVLLAMFANSLNASKKIDGRIANGVNVTDATEHPWMVYVVTASIASKYTYYTCGGVLIHPSWVLSSTACIIDSHIPNPTDVIMGSVTRNGTWASAEDKKVVAHFTNQTYYEHIALFKLSSPVTLSSTISTIPIYPGVIGPNNIVTATGWGGASVRDLNVTLSKVDLITISDAECQQSYGNKSLPADLLCARGVNYDRGICWSDEGGPLTMMIEGKRQLVGMIAFPMGDACNKGYPDAFARMSVYYQWIQLHIRN